MWKSKTLEFERDSYHVDETVVNEYVLRIMVMTRSRVDPEVGDIIFSMEKERDRYILNSRFCRSPLEYFLQDSQTQKTSGMTPTEIAKHKNIFEWALEPHPHGELLMQIYNQEVAPTAYYDKLLAEDIASQVASQI